MKKFLLTLITILATVSIIIIAYPDNDSADKNSEELNPAIEAFYQDDYQVDKQDYINQNGYIAWLGLHAPAEVKDTYAWAAQIAKDSLNNQKNLFFDVWQEIPEKTMPILDRELANCFLSRGWIVNDKEKAECRNFEELKNLIHANRLLLSRYDSQFVYDRFIGFRLNVFGVDDRQIMKSHELFLVSLLVESENNRDEALKKWIKNITFIRKALDDYNDNLSRNVIYTNYRLAQCLLPSLIGNDSALVGKYEKELLNALAPFTAKEINGETIVRSELQILNKSLKRDGINISDFSIKNQNKIYDLAQELIYLSHIPIVNFKSEYNKLKRKSPKIELKDTTEESIVNFILYHQASAFELIYPLHDIEAKNRLLSTYVKMRAKSIPVEQIASFINNSPAELYDPFTGKPFLYDQNKRTIYYINPQYENDIKNALLLNW